MREQEITDLARTVLTRCGLELDRVEFGAAGKRALVRIFVDGDGPNGRGPTIDEIAVATRALSDALDDSPATSNAPYVLEVSSRGVSRPLTEPKHYRRNIGRLVELRLPEEPAVVGRIVAADENTVTVEAEGHLRDIGLNRIARAVVQVELNRPEPDDLDEED